MNKLEVLNSFAVADFSCTSGECEYVMAEMSQDDFCKLYETGFTSEQVKEALEAGNGESDNIIDLSVLAFVYADATYWSEKEGFVKQK